MEFGFNPILSGSCLLLSFGLITYLIWKQINSRNYNRGLLLTILLGLILRVFVSTDPFLHEWDERYHALVAKNTIDNPLKPTLYKVPLLEYDYKSWVGNHVWLHKQPVPLWIMGASMKLFGVNLFGFRFPSIIFSLLAVWLTFLIGAKLFDKKTGLIAAYLHAINGLIIELTGGRIATDHVDIFFLFFIELSIWFVILYQGKRNFWNLVLIGFCTGCAVLTKWLPALIVLPIFMVLDYKTFSDKKTILNLVIIVAAIALISAPWQLYTAYEFPLENVWEKHFNWLHLTTVLDEQTGPYYYFFSKLRIHYGEIMYLPFLWFLLRKKNWVDRKKMALIIWILVPLLFFSISKTKMQGYTLFIAPAVFIMLGLFVRYLSFTAASLSKKTSRIMAQTILLLLILLPIRYSIERIKPFSEANSQIPLYMHRIQELQENGTENLVIENCERPIETMFFTNHIAYDKKLTINEREKIQQLGYSVIEF